MFSIFGASAQGVLSALTEGSPPQSSPVVDRPPLWQRMLRSKWSPVTVLSDEEYLNLLEEKLLKLDAEVAVIDDELNALRSASAGPDTKQGDVK